MVTRLPEGALKTTSARTSTKGVSHAPLGAKDHSPTVPTGMLLEPSMPRLLLTIVRDCAAF